MTQLRMNINHQALVKTASVLSNSVLLAANTYMIGSSFRHTIQDRRNQRISNNLQLAAEVSTAVAGLTKVIISSLESYHADG